MSQSSIINVFILAGFYLLLFAIGEILYHKFKLKVEITRKIVHVGTGLLAMLFPILLNNHWLVLLLCVAFACILIVSLKYKLLPSINAIDRKSVGSLAYPVSVYGCYLAFDLNGQQYIYYYLPILVLAICDPIAGLAGKKWPLGSYQLAGAHKTLVGSVSFFISAVVLAGGYWICVYHPYVDLRFISGILIVAVLSTLAEAVSHDGYDNISIPLAVIFGLILSKYLLLT